MKIPLLTALLFLNIATIYASNQKQTSMTVSAIDDAHLKLSQYFTEQKAQEKRVKDARTIILVHAAQELKRGITRKQLKAIRDQLHRGLLPNPANKPILDEMNKITDNHKRIFCCSPWIYQCTINRETESLYGIIDGILKQENPDTYATFKGIDCAVAYPVSTQATAPALTDSLLNQFQSDK